MTSPPPVENIVMSFLLLSFSSPSLPTAMPYSVVSDSGLPAPQWWPGIWRCWVTVFFISPMLSTLRLSSVLFCVSGITTVNENVIPSDVLVSSLSPCGTIIYILNWSPSIPLTKLLFSFIIKALIVCSGKYENMVLHSTPYPSARETVTSFTFTIKGDL